VKYSGEILPSLPWLIGVNDAPQAKPWRDRWWPAKKKGPPGEGTAQGEGTVAIIVMAQPGLTHIAKFGVNSDAQGNAQAMQNTVKPGPLSGESAAPIFIPDTSTLSLNELSLSSVGDI
jgi:hypothetical protein